MVLRHPKFGVMLVPDAAKPAGAYWSIKAECTPEGEVVVRARRFLKARATWVATGRTEERLVKLVKQRWNYLKEAFSDVSGGEEVSLMHYEYESVVDGSWEPIHATDTERRPFEGSVWVTDGPPLKAFVLREEVVDLPSVYVGREPGLPGFEDSCLEAAITNGWDDAL